MTTSRNKTPLIGWHSEDPTLKPWIEAQAAREGQTVREFLDGVLGAEREHRELAGLVGSYSDEKLREVLATVAHQPDSEWYKMLSAEMRTRGLGG
jgi:hypothetical protein